MTVKELKAKLESMPEDMQVFIPSNETEYDCVLAESISVTSINFHHPNGEEEEMDVVKLNEY